MTRTTRTAQPPRLRRLLAGLLVPTALLLGSGCAVTDVTASPTSSPSLTTPTTGEATVSPSATTSATPSESSSPAPTATTSKPKPPKPLLSKGDKGVLVRELQHRLLQLDWWSGKITGSYGSATVKAVKGFQKKRKLKATGSVDEKTWASLVKRTRKPTRDQMYNILRPGRAIMKVGSKGAKVRELQARLKQIGWFSPKVSGNYGSVTKQAVKGFQGKREIPVTGEVDQRTWNRLLGMTRQPTRNELYNIVPKVNLPNSCMSGKVLCISKSDNSLRYVVNGSIVRRFDVRFGSELTPTREGVFSIGWKSRNHVSSIYHTPMPFAMFFSGGQAVHYSADFAARGYNGASHGCVNVRDYNGIAWLFDQVGVGTRVVVYR